MATGKLCFQGTTKLKGTCLLAHNRIHHRDRNSALPGLQFANALLLQIQPTALLTAPTSVSAMPSAM
jgi:hypothetical protein